MSATPEHRDKLQRQMDQMVRQPDAVVRIPRRTGVLAGVLAIFMAVPAASLYYLDWSLVLANAPRLIALATGLLLAASAAAAVMVAARHRRELGLPTAALLVASIIAASGILLLLPLVAAYSD